ncbi:hypothetical protein A1F94_009650 [Pyrenophora tritici-repentis]|uniref:Uncharacterized protein n=1 Tax=Pyrenophora tritici-repentis TaxID=45151 RepID=A0A316ZV70_9PLEO|nr:hypothetical protein PtrV1_11247 [Pyrenophora tritici-repentis]KAF7566730.1 hypothetical protein PtrM4_150500 [Pyrenophora tritici-repentis]KAG9379294.1 hypothetical protein A1F94_009650 [Pyrenophora tritici-repentis]KAI1592605.1 hypothetical protein PtrEW13061_003651 [Pyrenophora tritici-repentis]KAI1665910.1 hypothetical protein L13192_09594 [Pyrenophora tritici-repentis]
MAKYKYGFRGPTEPHPLRRVFFPRTRSEEARDGAFLDRMRMAESGLDSGRGADQRKGPQTALAA